MAYGHHESGLSPDAGHSSCAKVFDSTEMLAGGKQMLGGREPVADQTSLYVGKGDAGEDPRVDVVSFGM